VWVVDQAANVPVVSEPEYDRHTCSVCDEEFTGFTASKKLAAHQEQARYPGGACGAGGAGFNNSTSSLHKPKYPAASAKRARAVGPPRAFPGRWSTNLTHARRSSEHLTSTGQARLMAFLGYVGPMPGTWVCGVNLCCC